jgi:hypothetical protein
MRSFLPSIYTLLYAFRSLTAHVAQGKYIGNTFRRRADADTWAPETERAIDKGFDPKAIIPSSVKTFGEIIDLHIQDMLEVGKKIRRSKNAVLESLKLTLGSCKLREMTRSALIDYGKKRAKQGAGPATLVIDMAPCSPTQLLCTGLPYRRRK